MSDIHDINETAEEVPCEVSPDIGNRFQDGLDLGDTDLPDIELAREINQVQDSGIGVGDGVQGTQNIHGFIACDLSGAGENTEDAKHRAGQPGNDTQKAGDVCDVQTGKINVSEDDAVVGQSLEIKRGHLTQCIQKVSDLIPGNAVFSNGIKDKCGIAGEIRNVPQQTYDVTWLGDLCEVDLQNGGKPVISLEALQNFEDLLDIGGAGDFAGADNLHVSRGHVACEAEIDDCLQHGSDLRGIAEPREIEACQHFWGYLIQQLKNFQCCPGIHRAGLDRNLRERRKFFYAEIGAGYHILNISQQADNLASGNAREVHLRDSVEHICVACLEVH